jgi:late competence protein required for DNA uptake (superfamily II DNA/RNA helicase)
MTMFFWPEVCQQQKSVVCLQQHRVTGDQMLIYQQQPEINQQSITEWHSTELRYNETLGDQLKPAIWTKCWQMVMKGVTQLRGNVHPRTNIHTVDTHQ